MGKGQCRFRVMEGVVISSVDGNVDQNETSRYKCLEFVLEALEIYQSSYGNFNRRWTLTKAVELVWEIAIVRESH